MSPLLGMPPRLPAFLPPSPLVLRPPSRHNLSSPHPHTSRAFFGFPWRARRRAAARSTALSVLRRAEARASAEARSSAEPAPAPHAEEVDPGAVEGTSLRILRYPHPLLRAPNAPVADDELPSLRSVAREMLLVMYASRGVGLAAPQVGINKRLMVFNAEGDQKAWLQEVVMVNPVIVAQSKPSVVDVEGCLSFPLMAGQVRRHEWVKVEAKRLNGKTFKVKFEGWKARIFQHEFDHLDGVLYIDRLEEEDGPKVQARLGELLDEYEAAPFEGKAPAL